MKKQGEQAVQRPFRGSAGKWLFSLLRAVGFQLLLRVLALFPALLALRGIGPAYVGYGVSALLYVLGVFPFRFSAGQALLCAVKKEKAPPVSFSLYGPWLKKGLRRLLLGLPFGLPLYLIAAYLVIGSQTLPYNEMWQPVQNLALIFGGEPTLLGGMLAALPFLMLMVLLFSLGWLANMPLDFGDWQLRRLPRYAGRLIKNFAVNTLLFLPAPVGALALLLPYVFGQVDFSGSLLKTIRGMQQLVKAPLPPALLCALAGLFVLVYLPLCILRKGRNARLANEIVGGGHAAG